MHLVALGALESVVFLFLTLVATKNTHMSFLLVFVGGGVGSVLRYWLSSVASWPVSSGQFPLKTFAVNMLGCFLIGLLGSAFALMGERAEVRNLFVAGFCGGFTTFSTFSREAFDLFSGGYALTAALYVVLSAVVGVSLVGAGYAFAAKVLG